MHPAAAFRVTDPLRLAAFVGERAFAVVVGVAGGRPLAAHAPVVLNGRTLRFHLSGANPLTEALRAGGTALAVVTGPDAYVSPDWYAAADQVPTWNYVSVEMEGPVSPLAPEATARLLDDLSAQHEAPLAPKAPWTRAKMSAGRFETMLAAIQGFELAVERFEGVWKLSQNKPAEVGRVAGQLAARPDIGARRIAALMADQAALEKAGLRR